MSPPAGHLLSKSTFLRGLQCHKSLYLNRFHKDLRDPLDPATQAVFERGHAVGELAQQLFPGGVLARASKPWFYQEALRRTQQLLDGGERVLYEPAFQFDGVLAYVDILVQEGTGWHLYEVKSSTEVKQVHVPDAAIQAYAVRGSGLELRDVSIIHLNNQYVRRGELDLRQLFTIQSVLTQVQALQDQMAEQVSEFKAVLRGGRIPAVAIGPRCRDPYDCDFMGHCWGHLPTPSVFDLSSLRWDRRFELYEQGFESIEQVPAEAALDETTQLIVERHRRGEAWVDREAIQTFLDGLHYPLCFLDFETINPAVPPYDGLRPYGQLPFLYSVYRQEGPSREPEHRGFLAEAGADPRRELAGRLLEDLGESGNVLVYGQSFEGTRLRELAEQVPDWAGGLEAIQPRLRDLMGIFRQRQYYHPAMHGSYSIKAVLPALVPELGYGDLAIADGTAAMRAYSELEGEVDAGRAETLRKDLWDYCQRDTLAMVRVVEALRALVA